jgi:RNA polymerase sigma factor (sigma-70 family)
MASALARKHASHEFKAFAGELSDEELLDQFLNAEEFESQEAFRTLVERHGSMVLGICRHVLGGYQDAEDAFQATFLVLAKKGGSIRNRRVLAGWLHEVAHRIAVKARASAVRRRTIERQGMAMAPPAIEPDNQNEAAAWNELRPVLHDEVERLPERYRIPVILSYLEGKTNEEVAALLRWPVGTVKGRLSRAREMLRSRLVRRGLALSAAFLMTALSHGTVFAEVVPAELVRRTVRLSMRFAPRSSTGDQTGPPPEDLPGPAHSMPPEPVLPFNRLSRKFAPPKLGLLLLAILSFSIATGIVIATFNPRGFSQVQGAIQLLSPRQGGAIAAPCH